MATQTERDYASYLRMCARTGEQPTAAGFAAAKAGWDESRAQADWDEIRFSRS